MNKKTIVAAVLPFMLLAQPLSSAYAEDKQMDALNQKVEDSKGKKEQLETELGGVKTDIQQIQKKIDDLTSKLQKTEKQINDTEKSIEKTKNAMQKLQEEIEKTKVKLEEKKKILAKSLRVMHTKGDVSFIEYLFRSDDVSDFFDRFGVMQDVAKLNKQFYKEVQDTYASLQKKEAELKKQQEKQEKNKESLENYQNSQKKDQGEQLGYMKQLSEKESSLTDQIHEEDAAMDEVYAQIGEIIRQRQEAKRQQELAAQQAREQAQANQNQTNNTGGGGSVNKPSVPNNDGTPSSIGLQNPMKAGTYHVSSSFGYRIHPITGAQKLHNGIDLASAYGTPIYAAGDGTVLFSGPASGYGNWIVIEHDNGYYTIYGHMYSDQLYVKPGERVTAGQHIAASGSAGGSTGNHLHFCLSTSFQGGTFQYVDPANYINF